MVTHSRYERKGIFYNPAAQDTAGMILALAISFVLRAWALHHRGVLEYDETYLYILGHNFFSGKGYTLNGLPHAAFPPLYPLLVGIAALAASGIYAATSAVSLLTGFLLPLPVYCLARDIHGRGAALFAALAAAAWPALFFYANNAAYAGRLYIATEPLYLTLVASGITFLWLFARRGGWGKALLAGVFFGLASLVRTEGPVLFAFLFLWLLLDRMIARRLWKRKPLFQSGLVAVAMLFVISPWLCHLRGVTGEWTLGVKMSGKVHIRDALWSWVATDDSEEFMKINYKLNIPTTWMEEPIWGVSPWHVGQRGENGSDLFTGLAAVADPDWRWLGKLWEYLAKGPGALLPIYAWFFILLGLLAPPWSSVRRRWWLLFFFSLLPMLLIAVSVGVLPRNVLYLLPLAALPLAKGLGIAGHLLRLSARRTRRLRRWSSLVAAMPAVAVFVFMIGRGVADNETNRWPVRALYETGDQVRERKLAQDLRGTLAPGRTLMVHKPWIAAWAGLDWRVTPFASPNRMLGYARNRGIDYALLEYWQFQPGFEPRELAPYLVAVFDVGTKMYLFDFSGEDKALGDGTPPVMAFGGREAGSP
ncbi:MAG: glycosyltransferase family 39 protein [Planctomycetota bacterium]